MTFNVLSFLVLGIAIWILCGLCEEWRSIENSYERNFLHGWKRIILFIDKYVFGLLPFAWAIMYIVLAVMPYDDQQQFAQFINSLNIHS